MSYIYTYTCIHIHTHTHTHPGLKWAVLMGNELAIVPPNATELKKCTRISVPRVQSLHLDESNKIQFACDGMTLSSARVGVEYEEVQDKRKVCMHVMYVCMYVCMYVWK